MNELITVNNGEVEILLDGTMKVCRERCDTITSVYYSEDIIKEKLNIDYDYMKAKYYERAYGCDIELEFIKENERGCVTSIYRCYEVYGHKTLMFDLKDLNHIERTEKDYQYSYSPYEFLKSFPNHKQKEIENLTSITDRLYMENWHKEYHDEEIEQMLIKKTEELQSYIDEAERALEIIETMQNNREY